MAHDPSKVAEVRAAYLSGLSLQAAADKVGIPFDTAKKWKQAARAKMGDDWDKLRSAVLLSEGGLEDVLRTALSLAIQQTQATLEMLRDDTELQPLQKVQANAALGDSLNKMGALIRRLMPAETDALGVKLETLKTFADYVGRVKPKALEVLADLIEGFGKELVNG